MSSEWNAELIAKFDSDRALKERLDELRRTYRGLPLEGVTGRSFVGRLIEYHLGGRLPGLVRSCTGSRSPLHPER